MSTPTTARKFGRNEYKLAARQVRAMRRNFADYPNVADTATAAYVALFTADATRAGDAGHFNAEVFTARTQLLDGDALASAKSAKAAKVAAEVAALEAQFAAEVPEDSTLDADGTEDAGPFEE